jgi:hypothetical protein
VPLAPNIPPQFDSNNLYKVLGVPMNATERQIKSAYRNLAKKHHPDRQPINLSKDDANRTFHLFIIPMRYWATQRKEGFMMHPCALVKQVMVMKRAMIMKIEIMMKIRMMIMMMTEMVMETNLLIKTVLRFHATGITSSTFAIVLGCNHQSAQLIVAIDLSINSVKIHLSKNRGAV